MEEGESDRTRNALVLLAAALVVATSCSSDDTSTNSSTPASTTATSRPDGSDLTYEVPAQHASDWGAPDVALPDAPLPYGPSPQPTADPAFYDVTTLDPAAVGAAEPGDVLRSEEVELTGPLAGPRAGPRAGAFSTARRPRTAHQRW